MHSGKTADVQTAKQLLRYEIWTELQRKGVARFPLPCFGRIPNFMGSEKAAEKARSLKEWTDARTVFASPDYAQQKVREYVLRDRKTLVMASPRLRSGFLIVNPEDVSGVEAFASTIRGAFEYGKAADIQSSSRIDLAVEGSVAVDLQGNRLGKGGGFGDQEIRALRARFGNVLVLTTVHDLQVVESVPYEEKDEKVSLIVTPSRILRVIQCL